jgi:hypothetical protein
MIPHSTKLVVSSPATLEHVHFYGYTQLLALRKETEAALGSKFNQLRFHDFVLGL